MVISYPAFMNFPSGIFDIRMGFFVISYLIHRLSFLVRKCQSYWILTRILFIWKLQLRYNQFCFLIRINLLVALPNCFNRVLILAFINFTFTSNDQIQLKTLAEEMQAVSKGLEKVEQELSASENDGAISVGFQKVRIIMIPVHLIKKLLQKNK